MAFEWIQDLGLRFAWPPAKRKETQRVLIHHFGSNSSVEAVNEYHKQIHHAGIDYNIVVRRDGSVVWGRGLESCGGSVNNSNAKTKGFNNTSVAVALQGNYETEPVPDAQWAALLAVVRQLVDYYGLPYEKASVLGHDEAAGPGYTDCPGRYVDLNAVRTAAFMTYTEEELPDGMQNSDVCPIVPPVVVAPPSPAVPQLTPEDYRRHIVKLTQPYMRGEHEKLGQHNLRRHRADCGGIDGIWGPKSDRALKLFQAARISEGRDCGCPVGPDGIQIPDGKLGPKTAAILAE